MLFYFVIDYITIVNMAVIIAQHLFFCLYSFSTHATCIVYCKTLRYSTFTMAAHILS